MNTTPATASSFFELTPLRAEAVRLVLPPTLARPANPVNVDRLAAKLDKKLQGAQKIALTGLHALSNDAIDAALVFAQTRNAAILLPSVPGMYRDDARPVSQHIALAEACQSELILWVGCDGSSGPVADWLTRHQLLGAFVSGDLAAVVALRAALKQNPSAQPFAGKKRVAVVLGPEVDRVVAGQWHRMAADMQTLIRVGVLTLPDEHQTLNARGLFEAIGIRFARAAFQSPQGEALFLEAGSPRLVSGLDPIVKSNLFDLTLDFAPFANSGNGRGVIHVSTLAGAVPLYPGMAAQITRFDAQTIALSDEQGDRDWAAQLLNQLLS
jgi:hypothetical protein